MKSLLRLCFLIHLATTSALLLAQKVSPQPLYTADLSKLISQELDINPAGTLTFLTEHTLAVSICRNLRCALETLDLGGAEPRVIARIDQDQHYSALFRVPDGRVILDYGPTGAKQNAVLLDSHLRAPLLVPKAAGIRQSQISITGETFVRQDGNEWMAYKTGPPPQRIRTGTGLVLSVSDEAVAHVDHDTVHIEGMDGKPLGSFAVTPRALPTIRFLGHDHLWSQNGSQVEILDFNGKPIQTLDRPDGWGFRIGQTSDGSRILYDRYTRHIPLAQKVEEQAIGTATGVWADEKPNGEMVLVIDTRSGNHCFEWNSQTNLLVAGQFHADIDPSGRLIAIMTPTTLNIYRLPEGCVAK
jgi:hypothetical protein